MSRTAYKLAKAVVPKTVVPEIAVAEDSVPSTEIPDQFQGFRAVQDKFEAATFKYFQNKEYKKSFGRRREREAITVDPVTTKVFEDAFKIKYDKKTGDTTVSYFVID